MVEPESLLAFSDVSGNVQYRYIWDDGRVTAFRRPSYNSNGNSFDFQGRQSLYMVEVATQGGGAGLSGGRETAIVSAQAGATKQQRMLKMSGRTVIAVGLVVCLLMPAGAAVNAAPQTELAQAPMGTPPPQAPAPNVDANIASLHQRLQITPAQEAQFNALANVMRQNARAEASAPQPPANASAIDYLRGEIQYDEMELAGMKRFLPALEALYATLSPAQKQTANAVFREGPGG